MVIDLKSLQEIIDLVETYNKNHYKNYKIINAINYDENGKLDYVTCYNQDEFGRLDVLRKEEKLIAKGIS